MSLIKHSNGILEMPMNPKYEPDVTGIAYRYFYKMKEFSNRIAQIDTATKHSDTYGDILSKSIRVALQIKHLGITDADNISICSKTHRDTCLPFWATIFLGAKLANLDPSISLSDLKHLTNITKPKLIFCDSDCVENLETVIKDLNLNTKLVIFGETDTWIPFKDFLVPQEGECEFTPKQEKNLFNTAVILYSSGTTGLAKAVCITHYGLLHTVNIVKENFDFTSILYFTSPYWISYTLLLFITLEQGGHKVLCPFNEKNIFNIIEDYKVTFLFLPPSFTYGITSFVESNSDISKIDISTLKGIMTGGGCIGEDQLNKLKNIFKESTIFQIYGLTEITALFSMFHKNYDDELLSTKTTSCGKMIPNMMCKIIDIDTNKILGPNQSGELLIKSKQIMNGYYKDPVKTAAAFDDEGFLHTGDVLYYDDDFCFYVVDRIKEMFKYKSWHIVPAELENILLKHPAVKEAIVIGYPNEEDGDHPMAVIVLQDGATVTENDILHYFNNQVSDRKQLRAGVKFVKNLPITATGKFNRRLTRNKIINKEI